MDRQALLDKLLQVGTITDDVERRTLLTEITDDVNGVYDNVDTLNTTISSITQERDRINDDLEKAQKANMELFLRVGEVKSPEEVNKNLTGIEEKKEEKRKFEDLFNEKGMIKR